MFEMIANNIKKRKIHSTLMYRLRSSKAGPLLMVILLVYAMAMSEPIKIHPLGDSTTHGHEALNCWRYYFYIKLLENGYNDIDLVGSKNGPNKGKIIDGWDKDHDGHVSQSAYKLLNRGGDSNVKVWAPKFKPRITVIYLGTNDIRGKRKTEDIIETLTEIIQVYRDAVKEVKIVVCQLPYWNWSKGGSKEAVDALNARIPSLKELGTEISPIKIVDLNTDYHLSDLSDKIHPGVTGAQKIADRVYKAVTPWLDEMTTSVTQVQHVINQPNRAKLKIGLRLDISDLSARVWIPLESGSDLRNGRGYLITGRMITTQ